MISIILCVIIISWVIYMILTKNGVPNERISLGLLMIMIILALNVGGRMVFGVTEISEVYELRDEIPVLNMNDSTFVFTTTENVEEKSCPFIYTKFTINNIIDRPFVRINYFKKNDSFEIYFFKMFNIPDKTIENIEFVYPSTPTIQVLVRSARSN